VKQGSLGSDVSIDGVDISFDGKGVLLSGASIKLEIGHRYALIGENGSGKTTLLRRMALGAIPGWPRHLRVYYLQQEDFCGADGEPVTVLDFVLEETQRLQRLRAEEEALEAALDVGEDEESLVRLSEALCCVVADIEKIEDSRRHYGADVQARVKSLPNSEREVLKGLGLTRLAGIEKAALSGGQRTRVAIAQALLSVERGECDVLCLDECTNHLDLASAAFVTARLSTLTSCVVVAVSHDAEFLEATCTDVIAIVGCSLTYFPGSLNSYYKHLTDMALFNESRVDAQHRKEAHIERSLAYARENGQDTQVKNTEKKLARASMSARADGKKFHLFSLKKLDEASLRLPEVVSASKVKKESDHPWLFDAARSAASAPLRETRFSFSEPAELRSSSESRPLITLRDCAFGWKIKMKGDGAHVLQNVTLEINMGTRVALIGKNGSGKSTLLLAIARLIRNGGVGTDEKIAASAAVARLVSGTASVVPNVTCGFVSQQHIDEFAPFLLQTPLDYLRYQVRPEKPLHSVSDLDLRSHLGRFGIVGASSLQPVGALSGGEKARLAMAAACLHSPQILLLEEPTNHLSPGALQALKAACIEFKGAIVFSSHSKHFVQDVATSLCELTGAATDGAASVKVSMMC